MSFPFYGKMWIATKKDLKNVMLCEKVLKTLEPTMNRNYAHELIGNLYVRYVILCNNLSELYDQTLQVQKRQQIEKLLLASQERLQEIQKDIQKIEMSQFVYADETLIELNLVPYDIEFLRPFYFPRRRNIEHQHILDEVPKEEEVAVDGTQKGLDRFRKVLSPAEIEAQRKSELLTKAVNAIKSHEKARQARFLATHIKHFPDEFKPKEPPRDDLVNYDFKHQEDQAPLFKMKRTKYQIDLYAPPLDIVQFEYYEPPQFRINKFGKKILIPKIRQSEMERGKPSTEAGDIKDEELIAEETFSSTSLSYEEKKELAAIRIQQAFLRYRLRKDIKRRKLSRLEHFGLAETPVDLDVVTAVEIQESHRQKRRERKREFDEAFRKALEDEKARILKVKSELIMEDITDDIRAWFYEFYREAKDFHRYPEEFEGGTIMVMRGETMTPEEFIIDKNKTDQDRARDKAEAKKAKKEAAKEAKKQKEREKKLEEAKKKLELKQGPTWDFKTIKDWKAFETLENTFLDMENAWDFIDDTKNRKEEPIWDWVTLDAYCDVHQELRLIVDNYMRVELEMLRVALAIETKQKYVPPKPKKEKKKKKKKEKKIEDVTEGRTLEECYEELKKFNVIRKYEKKSLRNFIGDFNFAAFNFRMANKNPPPGYGDVRNYIQNIIFGNAARLKSFCIIGPPKSGKKFLVEAICTEMEAVVFDLSAPIVKDVEDMPYFLNLVYRMAMKFQPSVIFVDQCHKPFLKSVPDELADEDPKKLGKFLNSQIVKNLTAEDAVVLIGTTSEPWNCNFAQLKQCFEKFAVFPAKLDFGTAVQAWRTGLGLKRVRNFEVATLANVSRSFSVGDILESIDSCLNLRRRMMLAWKPLTSLELLENLIMTKQSVDEKTASQYEKWTEIFDPYTGERKVTMARVQKDIDKAEAEKKKKKELQAKKDAKKGGKS